MVKRPRLNFRKLLGLFAAALLGTSLTFNLITHSRLHKAPGASSSGSGSDPRSEGERCPMARPQFILFGDSLTQHSFDEGGGHVRCESYASM